MFREPPDFEPLDLEPLERELPDLAALGFDPPERVLLGLALGLDPPDRVLLGLALGFDPPERGLLGLALGFDPPERGCVDRAPLVFRLRGVVDRVVVDVGRRVVVRDGAALSREEPDRAGLRSAPLEPEGGALRFRVVGGLDIWRYRSRTRSALSPAAFCRGLTRWGAVDCRLGTPRREDPFARAGSRVALVRLPFSVLEGAPRILSDEPGVEYCRGRAVWPRSSSAALRAVD